MLKLSVEREHAIYQYSPASRRLTSLVLSDTYPAERNDPWLPYPHSCVKEGRTKSQNYTPRVRSLQMHRTGEENTYFAKGGRNPECCSLLPTLFGLPPWEEPAKEMEELNFLPSLTRPNQRMVVSHAFGLGVLQIFSIGALTNDIPNTISCFMQRRARSVSVKLGVHLPLPRNSPARRGLELLCPRRH